MMELLEDVFIRCSRCGKVTGITKRILIFNPMYMIAAKIEWAMKLNTGMKAASYVNIAGNEISSEYLAMNILSGIQL